jgi:hypothetical protein
MAPGLARRHPEIKTYSGRGLTDPTATIHADVTPLGFRASVRSAGGSWYIDPYYVGRSPTVYASYYARNARETVGSFVERDADAAELSVDEGYYHAADTVHLSGNGFAENAAITITDPEEKFASRTVSARSDQPVASRRASSPIRTGISTSTSSRRATGGRRRRPATRSCATTTRPRTRPPASSSAPTGWP